MPPPSVNGGNPSPGGCGQCIGSGGGAGSGGTGAGASGSNPQGGDPIDLASGLVALHAVDLSIKGARGSVAVPRVYRTLTTNSGAFGLGSEMTYDYSLDTYDPQSAKAINLVAPDGNRFLFSIQPNGTFINTTVPWLQGAVLTATGPYPDYGTAIVATLRFKDGTVWAFEVTELDPVCNLEFSALSTITDPNGNQTTLTRPCTMVTAIADPVGRQLTLTYNTSNNVTSITDPIGRIVRYTYNPSGTLATVTDPNGGVTQYSYDAQNRMTSMIDPRGVTMFQNTFDANGRVIKQVAADGGVYQFAYTLVNSTVPTSPVLSTVVTDPLGHQTTYRFNPQGYVIQATDALGQTMAFNRAPGTNLLLSSTGNALCPVCGPPGAGNMSFTYDGNGNMLSSTDALGNTTAYTYDPVFNKVTSVTDPLGHQSTFAYDAMGNLTSTTDENGHTTTFTYDANGLPLTVTDPLGNTSTIAYDSSEDPISVTDPLGNVTVSTFDGVSRLLTSTDAMGRRAITTYDALNRVLSVRNGRGAVTQFAYDPVGNLLTLTDPRNNATKFTYDNLSRVQMRTDPLGRSENYQYDLAGNLTKYTDRRADVSTFQYDGLNRLVGESYQDGATVARSYDLYSRLLSVNDSAGGTFGFTYDAAGRLLAQSEPTGIVNYTRDALGRVATRQVAGQAAVTYSYDPAGNMLGAAMPAAGVTFSYDARNLPQQETRTNGVNSAYTFDPAGRLLSLIHSKGATALNTQTYSYDGSAKRIGGSNDISQPLVTQAITATVDASNELLTNAQTIYTYDANGNRLTESGPNGNYTYVWDGRNRLASITDGSGNKTSFKYDFARNLTEIDRTGSGVAAQKFVFDSLTNVVSLTDSSGLPVSALSGRWIDSHAGSVDSAGNVIFGMGDAVNSTVETTGSNGSVGAKLDYEPYGQTTGASPISYPFTYTGRIPIVGTVIYYRNRFYDTGTGRFLSQDPIGAGGGPNLYGYAGNSPSDANDPSGLFSISGSFYYVFGGGGEIHITPDGFALCVEAGVGLGEDLGSSTDDDLPESGFSGFADAKFQVGPVSGGLGYDGGKCGASASVGPYGWDSQNGLTSSLLKDDFKNLAKLPRFIKNLPGPNHRGGRWGESLGAKAGAKRCFVSRW